MALANQRFEDRRSIDIAPSWQENFKVLPPDDYLIQFAQHFRRKSERAVRGQRFHAGILRGPWEYIRNRSVTYVLSRSRQVCTKKKRRRAKSVFATPSRSYSHWLVFYSTPESSLGGFLQFHKNPPAFCVSFFF